MFTPTDTNNYNELTQDCPVTVVEPPVKNCNTLVGVPDKPCGTAQDELGLPGTVTITTVDGKTFNDIPVTWSGYDPNTLKEQTLTGTLDLTSIAGEVEQPSTPVAAQIKVKLTQKHFSGISPEAYDGVYDGKAHGITLTGVPSGATVKYGPSANSCTQDSLTYTNFTNGAKIVYYKVSKPGYADASGSAWVNITKRPLTVTGITANDKAYDGNTNVVLDYSAVTLGGVLKNDTLTVTATGTLESAGVGKQKVTISDLTLSGDSAANYVLAKSGNQSETTANITAKNVSISAATVNNKDYDGNANATVASVTITGVSGALSMGTDFDVTSATFPDADADTANVDVIINVALKGTAANNYNLTKGMGYVVTSAAKINKATYSDPAPTKTVNILKNYAGVQTGRLTAADFFTTAPAEAKITNAVPNSNPSSMMSLVGADSSGNFTYDSKTNITAASDESWTVTISSKNYTDFTGTLTFKLVDKTDVSAQITFPNGTLTYNGAGRKYEEGHQPAQPQLALPYGLISMRLPMQPLVWTARASPRPQAPTP